MMNGNSTGDRLSDGVAQSGSVWSRARSMMTPWRALLVAAMIIVLLIGLLAGSTGENSLLRWTGVFDDSDPRSGDDGAPNGIDPAERGMVGTGGESTDVDGNSLSGTAGSGPGEEAAGGSTGAGDNSGSGTAGSGSGTVPDPASPPPSSQPPTTSRAVAYLDDAFGEAMFPGEYPGLRQVNVFDYDDNEVTATYKDSGSSGFDIVRVTVQRTDSPNDATRALAEVRDLFPAHSVSYEWGGRNIVQTTDSVSGFSGDAVMNFSWPQGRYAIDLTVYPPYRDGAATGREAALKFIGRLEF